MASRFPRLRALCCDTSLLDDHRYEVVARTRLDLVMTSQLVFDAKSPHTYFHVSDGLNRQGWGGTMANYGSKGCPTSGCGPSPCGMMPHDFYAHGPRTTMGHYTDVFSNIKRLHDTLKGARKTSCICRPRPVHSLMIVSLCLSSCAPSRGRLSAFAAMPGYTKWWEPGVNQAARAQDEFMDNSESLVGASVLYLFFVVCLVSRLHCASADAYRPRSLARRVRTGLQMRSHAASCKQMEDLNSKLCWWHSIDECA